MAAAARRASFGIAMTTTLRTTPQTTLRASAEPASGVGLTVLVPAYNEAASVGDTVRSLQQQTCPPDEIIVIDSHSTDRTREIAAELGARVIENDFVGHIEQKNFAVDQASHDWILSLDADESCSEAMRATIGA